MNIHIETRVFGMVAAGGGQGLTRQAARSGPCNAAKLCLLLIPVLFKVPFMQASEPKKVSEPKAFLMKVGLKLVSLSPRKKVAGL